MADDHRFPTDPAREITNAYVQHLADELFSMYTPYPPMSDREVCQTAARILFDYAALIRAWTARFEQSAAHKEHANG